MRRLPAFLVALVAFAALLPARPLLAEPSLAPVVRKVAPAVVSIAITGKVAMEQSPLLNDPFFRQFFDIPKGPIDREIQAVGSGVVIDPREGLIVTNNHVVEHASVITVTLWNGRKLQGRKVGSDADTDLAVIRVPAHDLATLPLGNSDALQVGDYVLAIGNPFGIGQTVTHGIVSALKRRGLGSGYEDIIQTDAPINPGNSGGALVDLSGELIGINAAIIGPSGGNVGIGFAIPVNLVRQVVGQIEHGGTVRHGHLGIGIQDLTPDLARAQGLSANQPGALVASVDGRSIADAGELHNRIGLLRAGQATGLTVLRDGRPLSLHATVAGR